MKNLQGKRVKVYFNLHKNLYSVVCTKTMRVIAHTNKICLENVKFSVGEKSRQRVIREGRKNVHAFVYGNVTDSFKDVDSDSKLVTYNPYKYDSFIIKTSEKPVYEAKNVVMICENKAPKVFKTL